MGVTLDRTIDRALKEGRKGSDMPLLLVAIKDFMAISPAFDHRMGCLQTPMCRVGLLVDRLFQLFILDPLYLTRKFCDPDRQALHYFFQPSQCDGCKYCRNQ